MGKKNRHQHGGGVAFEHSLKLQHGADKLSKTQKKKMRLAREGAREAKAARHVEQSSTTDQTSTSKSTLTHVKHHEGASERV